MAEKTEHVTRWRDRQWVIPAWSGITAIIMLPLLVLFVMAATDDDENIVLARNDVVTDASDARVWFGAMMNRTDSPYREIAVTVRFLDRDDRPVGEVRGRADRLEPGERCAATSNRNFEGRQGYGGRTHLVSPSMAAAAAIAGRFVDPNQL